MDGTDREVFERSVHHAVETHTGGALDRALAELGWYDALAMAASDAVPILFEHLGLRYAASSALEHLVAASLELDVGAAAGILLPALGQSDPPGLLADGRLTVAGLGVASLAERETLWVVARSGQALVTTEVSLADLSLRPVAGMDPSQELIAVSGTVATRAGVDVSDRWPSALAAAQRALAHQLVGTGRAMLEQARLHALDRVQFGRPIGQFQAVRHRLAETLVALEAAEAVLRVAWEDGSPTTAAVAKALAGRGARTSARHGQQVLAGIGFTTEHPFHRYARRTFLLDQLFGASRSLTRQFGTELLAAGRLPAFAPL